MRSSVVWLAVHCSPHLRSISCVLVPASKPVTRNGTLCTVPAMSTRLPIVGVLYRLMLTAFLLPAAVPAQETTGSLEGRVLDERRVPPGQGAGRVARAPRHG